MPCDSTPQVECLYISRIQSKKTIKHSSLTVWATGVSNPICSPHFRSSVSINGQVGAFAVDVLTHILSFYRSLGRSPTLFIIQERLFLFACLIYHTATNRINLTTYLRFKPSTYAIHSPSLSYRGGWHRVCQGFFFQYL